MRWILAAALLALALPASAMAQTTTTTTTTTTTRGPSSVSRLLGEVTALSATQITIRADDGHSTTLPLSSDYLLIIGHQIQASDIKPGDFVATANTNEGDNAGRSVELRVFPPGLKMGEGSYPMDAPNVTMTNATVAEVTDVAGGRALTVRYPGGERHITLPADIVVVGQRQAEHAELQTGAHVRIFARPDAHGALTAIYVYTGEHGAAPPGR